VDDDDDGDDLERQSISSEPMFELVTPAINRRRSSIAETTKSVYSQSSAMELADRNGWI
jgi:hypothetical protein